MLKRNLPLVMTIVVFIAGYLYCLSQYPGFASTRVLGDLLTDNAFLGIVAVGMTFVIHSGGIDLSVGSTIAFTGVLLAKMIGEYGVPPGLAFVIVLVLGALYGALTGWIIDALRLPAFIITLASMFFLRGMSFILSRESVPIVHPWYDLLANYAWRLPGGGRLTLLALIMLLVAAAGMVLAHRTRFGHYVYAMGGQRLLGRPDGRAGEKHDGADLYAIEFSGGVVGYRVFSLYLSRLCSGGQRRGAGCNRGGGHRRYVIDWWRRHSVRHSVWRADPGADSNVHHP